MILRALTLLGDDPRRPDGQLVILVVGVGHRREIYQAIS